MELRALRVAAPAELWARLPARAPASSRVARCAAQRLPCGAVLRARAALTRPGRCAGSKSAAVAPGRLRRRLQVQAAVGTTVCAAHGHACGACA
jgi:hypothetical protein